ncbi:heme lyase CcmF/NrfE family subunit [Pelagibacterium luteolum]|uniref:Cytochrome c-type biogenesis protein CcmF n=1 Tax=Pelagibacterium luteolum TaxID=440168 RepID=A0A1G7TMT1_9HYPH|nr:heme lyase CcmF/NrfE family subunit [Pelagibacterium luteolum]SDG36412.1 cytochrome c-type biogenesis protein CcmF [Pelagibacterium luteolum]
MIIELGHFALILACILAAAQAIIGFTLWRGNALADRFVSQAAILQFALVGFAFAALCQAFMADDFSVQLAVSHSHSLQPMLYKFTSVWGNHEGSMLLFVLILVLFGAAVAAFGRNLPSDLRTLVLSNQGMMVAAFSAFVLFTSNPFWRLDPAPFDGTELNPVLQDIGLAIHPPLLYLGYVGFSICFSFAMAALISGKIDAAWARWVRPWTLASWAFLTLGIAMGSYWAYYELGWGGWWFWDPVENASFLPWLSGTALLHSAIVMEKRNALKVWTIFLAIITFSLSLLGTFLVRSGILTSVHSFASDPTRGMVILAMLAALIGGAFTLFALRASALRSGGLFAPISREGALILNNLFLSAATAGVLVGTLYPLVLESLTGARITVGAPFFDITFGALMVPLLLLIPFGPFLAWKRGDLGAVTQRLMAAIIVTVIISLVVYGFMGFPISLAPIGLAIGFWVMVGAIADLVDRAAFGRTGFRQSMARLRGLPRTAWSTALAHFGMGVTVLGVVCATAFQTEIVTSMRQGETVDIAGYSITYEGEIHTDGPNFSADRGSYAVISPWGGERTITSERRVYPVSGTPTTEAGIGTYGFSQMYIQFGERVGPDARVARLWHKPYVLLIWLGTIIMASGAFLSLTDRRMRVGAPAKPRRKAKLAGANK